MIYSGLPGRESLDGLDQSDLITTNKIGSLVFAEFLNVDIFSSPKNIESTITSIKRLYAWI